MIARLPGRIPAGTVSAMPTYFPDWFPTLCDAAALPRPTGLDGESIWPVLQGNRTTTARTTPMVWVFPEYGGQVAIRLGDFKLVRQNLKTARPGPWEIYDLSKDHAEANDLATARPDLITEAEKILRREVSENARFPVPIPGVNITATPPLKKGR
jgi:arylsulfatase A-like enzyme